MVFKNANDLLSNPNKDIRDSAFNIMVYVYKHCEDDLNTLISNLKNLRPVQLKEIKEQLSAVDKNYSSEYLVKLFEKVAVDSSKPSPGKKLSSPRNRSKSQESQRNIHAQEVNDFNNDEDRMQIDLLNLLPENFNEIPYVNQINTKRKSMEQFNQELDKLVKKQEEEGH